jgi:hypothetical protein
VVSHVSHLDKKGELNVYTLVIGELSVNGVKVADMGLEAHHREFLINATERMNNIPIKEFIDTR